MILEGKRGSGKFFGNWELKLDMLADGYYVIISKKYYLSCFTIAQELYNIGRVNSIWDGYLKVLRFVRYDDI